MGKFLKLLIVFLILGSGLYLTIVIYPFAFTRNSQAPEKIVIDIPPGSNLSQIRKELAKNDIHVDPIAWRLWTKFRADPKKLHVGEFEINPQKTQLEMLEEVLSLEPKTYSFVIKEGHNIFNIRDEGLNNLPLVPEVKNEFFKKITDANEAKKLGAPSRTDPPLTMEGFLFPSTYFFQKYDSAQNIFNKIVGEYKKRIEPLLKDHPWGQTPEGRYRLLTLASVVEKESGVFDEQPLIASVFWNRINKGMRLQSDPTTIYPYFLEANRNIDQFNLKVSHLRAPSPYNTYTLRELPVGPISNPGESAVRAVIKPAQSPYLYFVAKGDGTHVFASTLVEHNSNVDIYQKKIKKKEATPSKKKSSNRSANFRGQSKLEFGGLKPSSKISKQKVSNLSTKQLRPN